MPKKIRVRNGEGEEAEIEVSGDAPLNDYVYGEPSGSTAMDVEESGPPLLRLFVNISSGWPIQDPQWKVHEEFESPETPEILDGIEKSYLIRK